MTARTTSRLVLLCSRVALTAVILAGGGCDDSDPAAQPAEAVAKPEPAPKPTPPPEPQPEPEPEPPPLPNTPKAFEDAVAAATEMYSERRRSFYCGCAYTPQQRVARGTCGYKTRADESLGKRIAWDRVVPTRAFGAHRQCWREPICRDEAGVAFSGVRCCHEQDPAFAAMENDLHNLIPVVGELQEDRSDFDFGEIEREPRLYGACDFEVDRSKKIAEPREEIRGDIARAYLYMHETYGDGLPLTPAETAQFQAWHEADPADAWEVKRNRRIASIQGTANSFVPMIAGADAADEDEAPRAPAPVGDEKPSAAESDEAGSGETPTPTPAPTEPAEAEPEAPAAPDAAPPAAAG